MARRFHSVYAPSMVANGRKHRVHRNPLHGFHRNGSDDEFEQFQNMGLAPSGESSEEVSVAETPARTKRQYNKKIAEEKAAHAKKPKGKPGRPAKPLAEGEKAKPKSPQQKLNEEFRKLVDMAVKARTGGGKASGGHVPSIKIEVNTGAGKVTGTRGAKKGATHKADGTPYLPRGAKKGATQKADGTPYLPRGKKKAAIAANGRHGYYHRNPAPASADTAEAKAEKKKRTSTKLGPYTFTLLKNPITDFEVGGIKVAPAIAGTVGAVALGQLVKILIERFAPSMKPDVASPWKAFIPAGVTIGLAALGHNYATKKGWDMRARIASDVAAFGIAFGINDAVGVQIEAMVDKYAGKAETTPPPVPGLHGGRFLKSLNGGAFSDASTPQLTTPQLNGYIVSNGARSGYPNLGTGYPPTQLNGTANSPALARAIAMNGGAFSPAGSPIANLAGGHDLSGYAD